MLYDQQVPLLFMSLGVSLAGMQPQEDVKGKGKALVRSWSSPGSELQQEPQGHSPSTQLHQDSSGRAAVSASSKMDGLPHQSSGQAMSCGFASYPAKKPSYEHNSESSNILYQCLTLTRSVTGLM
jgi:hypothetical protein